MSGPLANLPSGLLDSLGIKSGSYPSSLLDEIRSTIDLMEIVAVNNCLELLQVNTVVSAVGHTTSYTVPQGETWLVAASGVQALTTATDAIVLSMEYRANFGGAPGTTLRKWQSGGRTPVGIGNSVSASEGHFWLPSGSFLGFCTEFWASAGTINVGHGASILRCRR